MKVLLIYNPHAGNGRAKQLLPQVLSYLDEKNISVRVEATQTSGHAVQLAAEADLSGFDALVASGGDGTLFEVLNGYMQNKGKHRPPLGLIPNGTGNAFMKELKLHQSAWKKAIDIIALNQPRKLDVGRFNAEGEQHYFLNMVGVGFVAEVAQAAVPLKWIGNAAYTLATLQMLTRLKSQRIELCIDGETLIREGIFVEVANSTFTGTTFLMAPKAKLDDGLLDIVLLNSVSRLRLLRLFTRIYDGSHIHYPEVEYFQAKSIRIVEERPQRLIPDGEILGRSPVEFECLPGAIDFLWRFDEPA